jgi:subtilisin family serine protease
MALDQKIDALNQPFEQASSTLTMATLDRIEQCLEFCRGQKLSLPRVINMSLAFEAEQGEEQAVVHRLSQILLKNDMLMVVAAGNDGKNLGDQIVSSKDNKVDLRNCLDKYPELCQNLLIVGAFFQDGIADYSARAGHAKEHTLIAHGSVFDNSTHNAEGSVSRSEGHVQGTSFAAPRVAALAVLLSKYFITLSMPEIKRIILKSAYKPADHNPEEIGHGVLDPMQAWIAACQLEAAKKPTVLGKLKSLFSKKK